MPNFTFLQYSGRGLKNVDTIMTDQLHLITEPISNHLKQVTKVIKEECNSVNSAYLHELLDYTFQVQGKLLRPMLVFSTAGIANNEPNEQAIWIAAGLEILHTASLVHDDIIDGGKLRRGQQTVHTKYGVSEATLLGDWLLAKSFELMTRTQNHAISHGMTLLTSELTEGQFLEMEAASGKAYDESKYMKMIDLKTASIFRYACQFACLCTPGLEHIADRMLKFGTNFGIMFQIIDDLIDLYHEDQSALKSTGVDILNGLTTLPIFRALEYESKRTIKPLKDALETKDLNFIKQSLPAYLMSSGVFSECTAIAEEYAHSSLELLNPKTSGANILRQLIEFTLNQVKNKVTYQVLLNTQDHTCPS